MTPAIRILSSLFNPLRYGKIINTLPNYFIHYTDSKNSALLIAKNGFHLKDFGKTGKRLNQYDMIKHDPVGIYVTELEPEHVDKFRPWVICSLVGKPNALVSNSYPNDTELKVMISRDTGLSGSPLTKLLLKNNIKVLKSLYEWIILDPKLLQVVDHNGYEK